MLLGRNSLLCRFLISLTDYRNEVYRLLISQKHIKKEEEGERKKGKKANTC